MNEKILLVDDDKLVLKSVGKALKTMGYDVLSAESGQEACKIAAENELDLIISDIRMPGMSGFETLKRIRNDSGAKFVPTIIITGYNSEEGLHDDEELGITEYLNKPFEIDELARAIKNNLEATPHYERKHPRISINFPAKIIHKKDNASNTLDAKTLTISEGGVSVETKEELPADDDLQVSIEISFPQQPFQSKGKVIWREKKIRSKKDLYGFQFLETDEKNSSVLKEVIDKYRSLSEEFVKLTEQLEEYTKSVKNELDSFDSKRPSEEEQIEFLLKNKKPILDKFTVYFDKIWDIAKDFDSERYIIHKNYYQDKLGKLLLDPIETNKRIYQKPLGYPGDYIMMNSIFEYNGEKKFLGDTTYQKLINHYTCNIPISSSNVARKDFLKEIVAETVKSNDKPKIISLGCGSARELIELVKEGKIDKPTDFICLDLEERALQYIKEEFNKIEQDKKKFISLQYMRKDILNIIRDRDLKKKFEQSNLIYLSGVYDYLSNKVAEKLIVDLYSLLAKRGKLAVCNISLENNQHRAYYELLGEWHMVHRTKKEILHWTRDLNKTTIQFFHPLSGDNYHFLVIQKEKIE